jgi:hypothetical protein
MVHGDDPLPDLAIGRLPASSEEQARVLAEKIVAYEATALGLEGRVVLVADNPDSAGNFDADAREIATYVARPQRSVVSLPRRCPRPGLIGADEELRFELPARRGFSYGRARTFSIRPPFPPGVRRAAHSLT